MTGPVSRRLYVGITQVTFNGVKAKFSVASLTSITTTVPVGAATGVVKVVNPTGTGTSLTNFTVLP